MPTSRQLARRAARARIAEFLATQIPADHDRSDPEIRLDSIGDFDVAFSDFWVAADAEHAAVCSARAVHGRCTECDALQLLRPSPAGGVSALLHERLMEIGQFGPFGEARLPVCLMRPSMAV